MKCKYEHDGDCCNCGSPQYMCKCKPKICHSVAPVTNADRIRAMSDEISIHAPRAGSDIKDSNRHIRLMVFQSMLPVRGATTSISELPLILGISIHAPRAGSDLRPPPCCAGRDPNFNPCSPCGERLVQVSYQIVAVFDFNPCSPCGERPDVPGWDGSAQIFQSMLPVRGATLVHIMQVCRHIDFNPCSPCGERLQPRSQGYPGIVISIHAPRAGSDLRARPPAPDAGNFNPCSPCGERQIPHVFHGTHPRFQSMLPVRGATVICFSRVLCFFISIHAPRAGSDPRPFEASAPAQKFQSMLPVRGATDRGRSFFLILNISIHAPRAGSDKCSIPVGDP